MLARTRSRSSPAGACAAVGVLLTGIYFTLGHGSLVQSVLYDAIAAAAGIVILVGVYVNRPRRRLAWILFATGQLAFAVGDVIFSVYERVLDRPPPVPSAADVFYLGGYPVIAAGLLLLILGVGTLRLAAFTEAGIVTFAFALAQWVFLMAPNLHEPGTSVSERAVALAYPAADIILLAGLAAFFVTPAWRTRSYQLLALSVVALLVADEIYGVSLETYTSGDWIDAGWLLSYTLWAASALHPSMRELGVRGRAPTWRVGPVRVALLAAALLTAPAIMLVQRLRGEPLEIVAVVAAASAISLLVVARLTGILVALERVRRRERAARAEAEKARRLLAEQHERLLEVDRLKDEFVAMISHDLRTPLTSIIGFLELVTDEPLSDEQRSYVAVVERNSERLLHLVDDLLFVARLQAGGLIDLTLSQLDLREIATHAVEEARPSAQAKEITLALDAEPVPPMEGDRGRIFQLIDNLVSNALKFTPEGGAVTVALGQAADRLWLEVRDTGIGIPPDEAERLFERFFRASTATDREIPGSGLGLYIARAIVEAHGGAVAVDSEVGKGTTFRIELPAAVTAAAPEPARSTAQSGGR